METGPMGPGTSKSLKKGTATASREKTTGKSADDLLKMHR